VGLMGIPTVVGGCEGAGLGSDPNPPSLLRLTGALTNGVGRTEACGQWELRGEVDGQSRLSNGGGADVGGGGGSRVGSQPTLPL